MGKKLTKPKKTTSQPKMILSNCEAIIPPKGCKNFPSDVLKLMKANAKPLMALKLMQVCKYFQHKNFPFQLIKGLSKKEGGSWNYSTTENAFCAASTIDNIHHKKFLFITQYLYLYQRIDPFSSFLSKVAIYQAKSLHFDFQNITFNEFKILTAAGTIETAKIRNTKITDENDKNKLAAFEKILECLPKVKELHL
uniref:Uncharacterized protein n=1 Tax=Panagrolaimus davidi TaxID=227884 RepID=A0A914R256_9BILA